MDVLGMDVCERTPENGGNGRTAKKMEVRRREQNKKWMKEEGRKKAERRGRNMPRGT